ncbi:MAG: L,D-transpeptidase, partial [Deltaproteobacteria bacterium]
PGVEMMALWIWVPIFERMDQRGPKLGYLRAGARVSVGPQPTGTDGCSRGWYAVQSGGYLCLNRMTTLNVDELGERRPVQPDLSQPLPYPYMTTFRAAVMYRWLPSVADMRETEPEHFGITPPNATASLDGGVSPNASTTTVSAAETPAVFSTTAPTTGGNGAGDAGHAAATNMAAIANRAQAEDAGVRLEDLQGTATSPLLRRMLTGMYVSVDREASSAGRRFWRTQNGGYVERGAVSALHNPPTFQGVQLDEQHPLDIAFITAYEGWNYTLGPDGHSVARHERAPRLSVYHVTNDPPATYGRAQYYRTTDGLYLNSRNVRLVHTTAPPAEVGPTEKWVEVNLDRQMLIAYEGPRPVYVTLISSGRRNREDETRNYETIQGGFRIQSKHVSTTMDGNSAGDGPYSIEDVPWVMYFENSFALHGAFWHTSFGQMHSHGCINMSPPDARWLFNWTEPQLPPGWHGVYSSTTHPGTRVYVHYEDQALGERGGPTRPPAH